MDWEPTTPPTTASLKRKRDREEDMPGAWPDSPTSPSAPLLRYHDNNEDAPRSPGCFRTIYSAATSLLSRFKRARVEKTTTPKTAQAAPQTPTRSEKPSKFETSPTSLRIPKFTDSAFKQNLKDVKERGPGPSCLKGTRSKSQDNRVSFGPDEVAHISPRAPKWFQDAVEKVQDLEIFHFRDGKPPRDDIWDRMAEHVALGPTPVDPSALENLKTVMAAHEMDQTFPALGGVPSLVFKDPAPSLIYKQSNHTFCSLSEEKENKTLLAVPKLRPPPTSTENISPAKKEISTPHTTTPTTRLAEIDVNVGDRASDRRRERKEAEQRAKEKEERAKEKEEYERHRREVSLAWRPEIAKVQRMRNPVITNLSQTWEERVEDVVGVHYTLLKLLKADQALFFLRWPPLTSRNTAT